jgi:hypothetical protein
MGFKKYDTSREDEINRQRIERMQQYINSLNKPYIFKDLPEAYNPVDPDHPQLGNVQARAGIDQGKSNTCIVKHTDGTQSRVWPAINTIPMVGIPLTGRVWSSGGYPPRGGQHQSPPPREAPLRPAQPPSTLDRMLQVGKAIGVIQ